MKPSQHCREYLSRGDEIFFCLKDEGHDGLHYTQETDAEIEWRYDDDK
jgi:hypothetical protein